VGIEDYGIDADEVVNVNNLVVPLDHETNSISKTWILLFDEVSK